MGAGSSGGGEVVAGLPPGVKEELRRLADARRVVGCSVAAVTRDRTVFADAWGERAVGSSDDDGEYVEHRIGDQDGDGDCGVAVGGVGAAGFECGCE